MAVFIPAFNYMLSNEGGYSNDASDPGGETKYGINKRDHPNIDIPNLTIERAEQIYRSEYWDYEDINNQQVATKLFDTAVNLEGTGLKGEAIKIVQQACNNQITPPMIVDGVFGTETKASINNCEPGQLLMDMCNLQVKHYQDLVKANPKLSKFLIGWCKRAVRLPEEQNNAVA